MYRNIFIAWYCLGVLALCFATFAILVPFIGADRAVGSLGFLGLLGFVPFFWFVVFRKEKLDERDYLFLQRATISGLALGWMAIFFTAGPLIFSAYILSESGSPIPLGVLWAPLYFGTITCIFSSSVSLIQSYRKGEPTEHGGQPNE
jgi:hypothetical protein